MRRWRLLAIGVLSIGTGACLPPPSSGSASNVRSFAPSPGQPRLQRPEQVIIPPELARWPSPLTRHAPRYPADVRALGLPGLVIVAFVIDTAGRVELPTVSIVKHPTHPSFVYAVCDFLATARFDWRPHAPVRGLVIVPFSFSLTGPNGEVSVEPIVPDPRDLGPRWNEMSPTELAAWIERQPHCG